MKHKWLKRLALVLAAPAMLAAVEIGLRLAGVSADPNPYDILLARSPDWRVYVRGRLADGREGYVSRFKDSTPLNFPAFPAHKPPGTFRIVVAGGSAAAGFPYDARIAIGQWLKPGLEAAYGNLGIESLNVAFGGCSIGQAVFRAREMLDYDPDALVVYCGNNEYRDTHKYRKIRRATRLGRALFWVRSRLLSVRLIQRLLVKEESPFRWEFLTTDRSTQTASTVNEERRMILHNYEHGLREIAHAARERNVPVIFCTVAVNERDWPPYGSVFKADTPDEARVAWTKHAARGLELLESGRPRDSLAEFEAARGIDDRAAGQYYYMGLAHEQLNELEAARKCYRHAVELDSVSHRAFGSLNEIVRRLCRGEDAHLADCVAELQRHTRAGLLGHGQFYDHCHPRPRTNAVMSRAVARALVNSGALADPGPDWLRRYDTALRNHFCLLVFSPEENARANLRIALDLLEGLTYRKLRSDLDRAEGLLSDAIRLDDTVEGAHFYMGVIRFLKNDLEGARREWNRELQCHPDFELARTSLREMRSGDLKPEHLLQKEVFNP